MPHQRLIATLRDWSSRWHHLAKGHTHGEFLREKRRRLLLFCFVFFLGKCWGSTLGPHASQASVVPVTLNHTQLGRLFRVWQLLDVGHHSWRKHSRHSVKYFPLLGLSSQPFIQMGENSRSYEEPDYWHFQRGWGDVPHSHMVAHKHLQLHSSLTSVGHRMHKVHIRTAGKIPTHIQWK